MRENEITPPKGQRRPAKRVGRGHGSGRGITSGKGQKGQNSRSGVTIRPGFEGGQLPIIKRLPEQRGFRNPFRVEYQVVNVQSLDRFDAGSTVTLEMLRDAGLVRTLKQPVKVLGEGEITKELHVVAHKISAAAKEKIIAAGGTVEELNASTAIATTSTS
ncbi:MAG: ribosomal protein [Dehalococcoidia bacterium]|nr:ribosomal protein [Dehalococcoidia bacterium]